MSADTPTWRARRTLLMLLTLFFGSLAAAALLYYGGFRPGGSTSHGDLIQPARQLPNLVLLTAEDQTLDAEFLRSKWSLGYVGDGTCNARCREALTLMRQVQLALGKDSERVQRVFFATRQCCDQQYLRTEHPGLITARLDEVADRPMLELFPGTASTPASEAGRIYIVDPLGNLMMSYAPGAAPKGLLNDLKKLLHLSRIG